MVRGRVKRAAGGLDVDVFPAQFADVLLGGGDELAADAGAVDGRIHDDPVEVVAVKRARDQAVTAVAEHAVFTCGDEEEIIAGLAPVQSVVNEFEGDDHLVIAEEFAGADDVLQRGAVGRQHFIADFNIQRGQYEDKVATNINLSLAIAGASPKP